MFNVSVPSVKRAKAVRDHFLAAEREKAKERQAAAGPKEGRGKKSGSPNFGTAEKGRAKDKASQATGYSADTLDKVDAVVAAAEAEPEKFAAVAEPVAYYP